MGMGEEGNAVLDDKLRRMAGDITKKHGTQLGSKCAHNDEGDEEDDGDNGDGSTFEDLDEVVPTPVKKARKAKNLAKLAPTSDKWTAADFDGMCQNRYGLDQADMIAYHRNYLSEMDKMTFNLKDHLKYLDLILAQPSIAQDVVFTKEAGHLYFQKCKKSTTLYDQGMFTPLSEVPGSQWFLDKEVVAVVYIMVIVACQNITEDDPNGFGHTCLMGLWGLHTEKELQHCCKTCADGINKVLAAFCLFCKYWITSNSALNNHVRKHYGMAMSCYHDSYTTGSMVSMKHHMTTAHKILMESAPEKSKRTNYSGSRATPQGLVP